MNLGVSIPLPAYLVDAGAMPRTAEALGFESFWCAEHPFIPVRTTSRIKLGTRIVLVPGRHPLLLAKEVSTLGATRVIIRPATSTSEAEMVREFTRIAEAVMR
jgi:hypothetical protein